MGATGGGGRFPGRVSAGRASPPGSGSPSERSPRVPGSRRRRLLGDVLVVAAAVAVAILVRTFVAQAYWIPSASMVPQLEVNDRVVVTRLAYDLHAPRRGDIVVFKSPPGVEPPPKIPSDPLLRGLRDIGVALGFAQDQTVLIKRVIGLPGEEIEARGGHVYIDGDLLVEPYLPKGTYTSSFGPLVVPKGDVFVMGDNRGDSLDSRYFGPIPERTIVGRAGWRIWPFWRASFL